MTAAQPETPRLPSEGHITRLWDLRALLVYRASQAVGPEGRHLLVQADEVSKNLAIHLGEPQSNIKDLTDIRDLKTLIHQSRNGMP